MTETLTPGSTIAARPSAETAMSAVAAAAEATIKARYAIAYSRPRNWDQVRVGILRECERPVFAEVARYNKPIGKGVQGPSIRFVEAALRNMSNVLQGCTTLYDDDQKRIVSVTVTDLESNTTYEQEITVSKMVERRKLTDGQVPISSRTNSQGHTVYLVQATDDDLLNKEGALRSKAIRTLGLRLIPGDLVDEAMGVVDETQRNRAAKDPDGERKRIVDAFVALGVQPVELARYLGHDLAQCVPAELVELRRIYTTLRDGEARWADYATAPERTDTPAKQAADSSTAKLRQKLADKAGAVNHDHEHGFARAAEIAAKLAAEAVRDDKPGKA
jgi:hypothetical protein